MEGSPLTVLVGLPTEALDGTLRRMLSPVVLIGGGLLLVFTACLAFWVDRKVATPLNQLGRIAGAFGRGAPLPEIPPSGLREIDAATQALAAAADAIGNTPHGPRSSRSRPRSSRNSCCG